MARAASSRDASASRAAAPRGKSRADLLKLVRPDEPGDPLGRFGVIQPQEVILGLLGEYVDPKERVWSGGLVHLLRDLHFSPAAARIALNRVVARGLLQPSREGRFIHYSITPRLAIVHDEGRKQLFARTPSPTWDGKWTLVRYAIPEGQRAERLRLSRWLTFRGFGLMQDGMWIAAGSREADVLLLADKLGLASNVFVFTGALASNASMRDLVQDSWNLGALATMYGIFHRTFLPYANRRELDRLSAREHFVLRTRLIEMFRQMSILDPNVPDAALGIKWQRREAIDLFVELQARLNPAARAYFRSHGIRDAVSSSGASKARKRGR